MQGKYLNVGKRIKQIRQSKGLTQMELARNAGLAQSFVSTLERGHKSPTIRSLEKIAAALDVPPKELLSICLEKEETNDTW